MTAALAIPPEEVQPEGPQITATVGLYLVVATFASLIVLIQHVSTMLQAPNIAAAAGAELRDVVLAEMPDAVASDSLRQESRVASAELLKKNGYPVSVGDAGFIEYVDPEALLSLSKERNLVVRLLHKPGHFVSQGEVVAMIWPVNRVDEQAVDQFREAFRLGNTRTPTQDISYAVNQLVEMAVRAMSPAINDPFTAMTCLDYIGEGLALFIRQGEKGSYYYDIQGQLRLILEPVTISELLNCAFDMIRHASRDNASVLLHMLEVIDKIGEEVVSPAMKNPTAVRQKLGRQVKLILAESQAGESIRQDLQLIRRKSDVLVEKLLNLR